MTKYFYKSVKYTLEKWRVVKALAELLSAERGTTVSMADASVEASKLMLESKETAATPGGQAQD